MHRTKFLCIHCLKTAKEKRYCCGGKTLSIGYKIRPPKSKASKQRWRMFLKNKVVYVYASNEIKYTWYKLYKRFNLPLILWERDKHYHDIIYKEYTLN